MPANPMARLGSAFAAAAVLLPMLVAGCGPDADGQTGDAKRPPVLTATQRRVRVSTLLGIANQRLREHRRGVKRNPGTGKLTVDEAIDCLQRLLRRHDPENYAAHMQLGQAYKLAGNVAEAEQAFKRAGDLAEQQKFTRWQGISEAELTRRRAEPKLQISRLMWESTRPGRSIGMAPAQWRQEKARRKRLAVDVAEDVFERFPRYLPAAQWLADLKSAIGEYQAALGHVEPLVNKAMGGPFPDDVKLLEIGAYCARRQQLWDLAIRFQKHLTTEVEPTKPSRWLELAEAILAALGPNPELVGPKREWVSLFHDAADEVERIGDVVDKQQMAARLKQLNTRVSDRVITGSRPVSQTRQVPPTQPAGPTVDPLEIARLKQAIERSIAVADFAAAFEAAEALAEDQLPKDPDAHALAARAAFAWGKLAKAAEYCRSGLALDAGNVALAVLLGRCHADAGRWAEAADAFGRAGDRSPAARLNRAVALIACGKQAHAAAELAGVIALEPENLQARVRAAKLLETLNRPADARGHWQWLLGKYPDLVPARLGLGDALLNGRFAKQAVEHFRFVIKVPLGEAQTLSTEAAGRGLPRAFGVERAGPGELRKARIAAWMQLALCLQIEQEYAEAIKAYSEVLKIDASHVPARNGLGRLYASLYNSLQRRGELRDLAVRQFRLSLEADPEQPEIRELLKSLEPEE